MVTLMNQLLNIFCVVMPKISFINLYQNSLFIKVPNPHVDISTICFLSSNLGTTKFKNISNPFCQ